MPVTKWITRVIKQMHSVAIIENNSVKTDEIWDLDALKKTLSCSDIGMWTYNVINKVFTGCEKVEEITDGSISGIIPLRNMLRLIYSSSLRKAFYAFHACYHNCSLLQLEVHLTVDKWILMRGIYNPKSCQFQGLIFDISERKISDSNVSTLIAKLGHELRSPLTTIRLYTQQSIKIAQNINSEIIPLLETADRQISRINTLVDDFMLASTAEGNALELRRTRFFVKDLVKETIVDYFPSESRKRISLRISKRHAAFADREKIIQVLNNYVGNALKYSKEASRIIIRSQEKKDQLVISVQDFGIGIGVEEQKSIFQKYYRCKNVLATKGYGIGLFVVREIIEAHNGSFGVRSKIGRGSTFYFSIPFPK
ncbi:sensor histidine kinase KdpD [Mucilaginibacter sp. SG564]|uniref:sensor histidine kinase n=1 Tax=Mucilaginibacter sp. SG564 TaxID=2587022 RepID=UPI00155267CC|nr:HAMP domain-containing sensor histidine kinase [Mucilaginibacter sp. SG564]NOW96023.1 signal transduction histidine kinase [Mucilaginibacter sp. SG564]